ncbi:50S ribosomal protein L5 [Candidatus Gracilibacteria bacterium]|nr:50S ribosomal protein L5 [Candidatus Gracilibacteria bacterium]MCF7856625.1 50S ribosomal protein L5 [Candidatus Gracilibacteria bacterium]MCF7896925.1 50S ribosomal protein L5 [Candidatus Gracilibacteria bacterium]
MNSIDLFATVKTELLPAVGKKLGVKNIHAIPQIDKVKVAVGVGKTARKGGSSNSMDETLLTKISNNIATITNQKPRTHLSKKAISNFKLRAGMPIGISVTLRKNRALDFINKLVNIALPRVRDFRGLSRKSFDGHGNYSLGMKDFTVFPEVSPEDAEFVHGIEITVCTTANSDEAAKELLTQLGFPFQKDTSKQDAAEAAEKEVLKEAQKAAEEAALAAGLTKKEEPKPEVVEGEDSEAEVKDSQDSKNN